MDERRTVMISGGGGPGMGRASALAFAGQGCNVVIADVNLVGAQDVAAEIANAGGEAFPLELDVTRSESCDAAVAQSVRKYGQLDVLVNFAGVTNKVAVVDLPDESWLRVISVNLNGTFFLTRAIAREMTKRKSGTMILIASDNGLYGGKNRAAYAASKAGIIAYMKSLALELGQHNVTVNAINPGPTDTPRRNAETTEAVRQRLVSADPLGKISTPEDIAEIVMFLAGPGGAFMTGQLMTTRMRAGVGG